MLLQPDRRARLDSGKPSLNCGNSLEKESSELGAFSTSHHDEVLDCLGDDSGQRFAGARIHLLAGWRDHVRQPKDRREIHFSAQRVLFLQFFQSVGVLGQTRLVDNRTSIASAVDARRQRDMSAGDFLAKNLSNLALPPRKRRRKLEIRAEEAVIDSPDLDTRPRIAHHSFSRAEAGHAGYHVRWAILWRDKEVVYSRNPTLRRRLRAPVAYRSPV